MEYIDGRTLMQFASIKHFAPKIFSEWQLKSFIKQLFSGMIYLHTNRVIHGDLHQGNVMLQRVDQIEPNRLNIKIVDFGLAQGPVVGQFDLIPDIRRVGNVCEIMVNCTALSNPQLIRNIKNVFHCMKVLDKYPDLDSALNDLNPFLNSLPDSPQKQ